MLVLFAGVLDLGRVFYATITLNNAAREGAFQAAQTPDSFAANQPCDVDTNMVVCRVQLEAKDSMISIDESEIQLECSTTGCPDAAGSMVTVRVRGTFQLVTPLLAAIFGGPSLNMTSSATTQVEYLPEPNTATPPPGPGAAFTTSTVRTGAPPLEVQFVDLSSGTPSGWQWDFGDGGTSVEQNPTHVYGSDGTYTVTLTVVNLTGADIETKTDYVTVVSATPPPTPTPTTAPTGSTSPGPSGSASPSPSVSASESPTPAPTASCAYPPNVMGDSPTTARARLQAAGFQVTSSGDLSTGQKNKIQAQNPDHTQCLPIGSTITIHYRPA